MKTIELEDNDESCKKLTKLLQGKIINKLYADNSDMNGKLVSYRDNNWL